MTKGEAIVLAYKHSYKT